MTGQLPQRVLVVGLGISGVAAAEALAAEGASVTVIDEQTSDELKSSAKQLRDLGVDVQLEALGYNDWAWPDLVVASPGVPPSSPLLSAPLGAGARVISEIELGWILAEGSAGFVGVTGTNGKTTTTALLAEILNRGHPGGAVAAGNIGLPLTEAVRKENPAIFVTEVSSFQLKFVEEFHPSIAILLNVADDHFDWHAGSEDYIASKARITENQNRDDLFIFLANDSACVAIAAASRATLASFGLGSALEVQHQASLGTGRPLEWIGALEAGWLIAVSGDETRPIIAVEDIRLRGRHNLENVLAASIAALRLGVDLAVIADTVREFEGLPHRVSFVRELGGVIYLDDSKGTNPHATLQAMDELDNVVLIAGGRSRSSDLTPLRDIREKLRGVVVMGEAADELQKIFSGLPVHRVRDVEEAVLAAGSMASKGDTVLLSPACASFDQYSSYKERGTRFQEAVRRL